MRRAISVSDGRRSFPDLSRVTLISPRLKPAGRAGLDEDCVPLLPISGDGRRCWAEFLGNAACHFADFVFGKLHIPQVKIHDRLKSSIRWAEPSWLTTVAAFERL